MKPSIFNVQQHADVLTRRAKSWLRTKYAAWVIIIGSFLEAALITPFVIDPLVVAYILADKSRTVYAVIITSLSSVAGGVAAYVMAQWFFSVAFAPFLKPEMIVQIESYTQAFQDEAFLMAFIGAFTPVPYTFVALAAGLVDAGLMIFIIASVIGRTMRYAILGWFTYRYGDRALQLLRDRMLLVTVILISAALLYIIFMHR